ncbi:hypothetical protein KP509_1Z072700 [Ceratopteris richardii]|nr:hypothetical protein KP509_1Z072700 [Ceratopteris richardii]
MRQMLPIKGKHHHWTLRKGSKTKATNVQGSTKTNTSTRTAFQYSGRSSSFTGTAIFVREGRRLVGAYRSFQVIAKTASVPSSPFSERFLTSVIAEIISISFCNLDRVLSYTVINELIACLNYASINEMIVF